MMTETTVRPLLLTKHTMIRPDSIPLNRRKEACDRAVILTDRIYSAFTNQYMPRCGGDTGLPDDPSRRRPRSKNADACGCDPIPAKACGGARPPAHPRLLPHPA